VEVRWETTRSRSRRGEPRRSRRRGEMRSRHRRRMRGNPRREGGSNEEDDAEKGGTTNRRMEDLRDTPTTLLGGNAVHDGDQW